MSPFFLRFCLLAPLLAASAPQVLGAPARKPAAQKPAAKKAAAKPAVRKPARPAVRPTPKRAVVAPVVAPVENGPRTFALLVGVGSYASPAVARLTFPARDAEALRDSLIDPRVGAIPPERVLLLSDEKATRAAILGAVDTFFKPQVRAGDRMIVFLAGHGIAKGVGLEARSWLLPHDVKGFNTSQLESSGVEMKVLSEKLGELPASQFALFIDACREDPTPGRGVKSNALSDVMARSIQITAPQSSPRQVDAATMFACSVGERAYEDAALGHGVFTHAILQALRDPTLPRENGLVDAAVLATYVSARVDAWTKKVARDQDVDLRQTPELVAGVLSEGVRILRVRTGGGAASTSSTLPARLSVLSVPDHARVFLDGKPVGLSPMARSFAPGTLPESGEVTVRIESAGGVPFERTIKLLPGYLQQIEADLVGARSASSTSSPTGTSPSTSGGSDLLTKASEAESRGDYYRALAAYELVIQADAKNGRAHERRAQLLARGGKWPEAIAALAQMNRAVPGAHSLSLLSRAYSSLSILQKTRETADQQKPRRDKKVVVRPWLSPANSWESANYGFVAANEALKSEPNNPEALVAQGLALVAGDEKASNRDVAMRALNKAALLDEQNADAHFALGLAIKTFAVAVPIIAPKNAPPTAAPVIPEARKAEMTRARQSLARAIELRPDFYEARREMALCAALMGDRETALRECEVAIAHRGGASDANEFAALDVAMAAWHGLEAQEETDPEKKEAHQQASQGYVEDATETATDKTLKVSLSFLGSSGFGRGLFGALPARFQSVAPWITDPGATVQAQVQNKIDEAEGKIQDKIQDKIKLPRIFGR